ncbi:MAG: AEC family transporter, partial [Pseudomonadota bacterium]
MNIFFTLLGQIIPLYFLILLGAILGKRLKIDRRSVASLLIYFISPTVFFHGLITGKFSREILLLPLLFFSLALIISLAFYFIGRYWRKDSSANLLGFCCGSGNTGYFGLPIALALWGHDIFQA